jgi:hypothetical protein
MDAFSGLSEEKKKDIEMLKQMLVGLANSDANKQSNGAESQTTNNNQQQTHKEEPASNNTQQTNKTEPVSSNTSKEADIQQLQNILNGYQSNYGFGTKGANGDINSRVLNQESKISYDNNGKIEGVNGRRGNTDFDAQVLDQTNSKIEIPKLTKFVTGKALNKFYNEITSKVQNKDSNYTSMLNETMYDYYVKHLERVLTNNAFDYSNHDMNYAKKGLYLACAYLSNVVAMAHNGYMDPLQITRQNLYNTLSAANDASNTVVMMNSAVALGILKDTYNGALELDQMPTMDKINTYTDIVMHMQPTEIAGVFDISGNGDPYAFDRLNKGDTSDDLFNLYYDDVDTDNSKYAYYTTPEEEAYAGDEVYSMDRRGNVLIKPRRTQPIMQISRDKYIKASVPKFETAARFKKSLFESAKGTSYEFKKRWDFILRDIRDCYEDKGVIRKVALVGNQITVNTDMIDLGEILGGEYAIELQDIANIHKLLKKFPTIQELLLDSSIQQCLIQEYGSDARSVWKLFQENTSLQVLGLIPAGSSVVTNYHRSDFANTTEALEKQLGTEKTKMQIEMFAATKNPRLQDKSPGYKNRIWTNTKDIASNIYGVGLNQMKTKDPKFRTYCKQAVKAGVIIGFGGVFSILGRGLYYGKRAGKFGFRVAKGMFAK